jgi:integrase/recombinase XerD
MQRAPTIQPSLYARDGGRKYLTPSERARFIAVAQSWPCATTGTLCLMLAYTGCRISEALALSTLSVDAGDLFVAIRSLKKRGQFVVREIPLPDLFVGQLRAAHDLRDPSQRLWPYGRSWAWTLVKQVMNAAGICGGPHATPKGLRHGFAIHALRANVPITLVKRWLGHSRLTTTELYLGVIGPDERAFAARMWDA